MHHAERKQLKMLIRTKNMTRRKKSRRSGNDPIEYLKMKRETATELMKEEMALRREQLNFEEKRMEAEEKRQAQMQEQFLLQQRQQQMDAQAQSQTLLMAMLATMNKCWLFELNFILLATSKLLYICYWLGTWCCNFLLLCQCFEKILQVFQVEDVHATLSWRALRGMAATHCYYLDIFIINL